MPRPCRPREARFNAEDAWFPSSAGECRAHIEEPPRGLGLDSRTSGLRTDEFSNNSFEARMQESVRILARLVCKFSACSAIRPGVTCKSHGLTRKLAGKGSFCRCRSFFPLNKWNREKVSGERRGFHNNRSCTIACKGFYLFCPQLPPMHLTRTCHLCVLLNTD